MCGLGGLEVVLFASITVTYFGLVMLRLFVFMLDLSCLMFVLLALGLGSVGISVCGYCWLVCSLIVLLLLSSFNEFELVCVYLFGLLICFTFWVWFIVVFDFAV